MAMIIKYDSEADVLVVKVKEGALADEELLENDIILGCDKSGKLVSLEILDASKKGLLNAFVELAKSKKETTKQLLAKIS
jgi:uncharacterized protein YuzE